MADLENKFSSSPAADDSSEFNMLICVELKLHCKSASDRLINEENNELFEHGARALITLDALAPIMHAGDPDVIELMNATREELQDAYMAVIAGRSKLGFAMLRGVMEGLLTTLYYRQQRISLNLWASGTSFHMVHQLLESNHEFRLYYRRLFEDDRFKEEYPGVAHKRIFEGAIKVYDDLSSYVHKKSRTVRSTLPSNFEEAVEQVFRVAICFLEREEQLPKLIFPTPASLAAQLSVGKASTKVLK